MHDKSGSGVSKGLKGLCIKVMLLQSRLVTLISILMLQMTHKSKLA